MVIKKYSKKDEKFFQDFEDEISLINDEKSLLYFIQAHLDSGDLSEDTPEFLRIVVYLVYALKGPKGFYGFIQIAGDSSMVTIYPHFKNDPEGFDDFYDALSVEIDPFEAFINDYRKDPDRRDLAEIMEKIGNRCEWGYEQD